MEQIFWQRRLTVPPIIKKKKKKNCSTDYLGQQKEISASEDIQF